MVLSYLVGLNHSNFHSQEGLSALKALFWERGKKYFVMFSFPLFLVFYRVQSDTLDFSEPVVVGIWVVPGIQACVL